MESGYHTLDQVQKKVLRCTHCPRLVQWRTKIARVKTRRYLNEEYWGKPVPSFGDTKAHLLIVGLAPAAHGANRTGRMFTGDESGRWLYRALYKAGFANLPLSAHRNDGLILSDCYITAACRCAPPLNKPATQELDHCRPYLVAELELLNNVRVILGLGKIGFDAAFTACRLLGYTSDKKRPVFSHGGIYQLLNDRYLIGSYHPSQQNTFTGRLTENMFDSIFQKIQSLLPI
jgi:uracil-DNA glycosylase family 4